MAVEKVKEINSILEKEVSKLSTREDRLETEPLNDLVS